MPKILIIDTSYLIYRSYFAYPKLTFEERPVGAFFGFAKTILALIGEFEPTELIFANDRPELTWRHGEHTEYKAGRAEIEPAMIEQFPLIKNWCQKVSLNFLEKSGFEADDLIATSVWKLGQSAEQILIFSSDRDLYQLLNENKLAMLQTDKLAGGHSLFDGLKFREKFGLCPEQWLDYKALVGDSSDNLPGLSGVGPKTATLLLQEFESLDKIFALSLAQNSHKLGKWLTKIQENREQLERIRRLATLQTVPETNLHTSGFDLVAGLEDFQKCNFRSLINLVEHRGRPSFLEEEENLNQNLRPKNAHIEAKLAKAKLKVENNSQKDLQNDLFAEFG